MDLSSSGVEGHDTSPFMKSFHFGIVGSFHSVTCVGKKLYFGRFTCFCYKTSTPLISIIKSINKQC